MHCLCVLCFHSLIGKKGDGFCNVTTTNPADQHFSKGCDSPNTWYVAMILLVLMVY